MEETGTSKLLKFPDDKCYLVPKGYRLGGLSPMEIFIVMLIKA